MLHFKFCSNYNNPTLQNLKKLSWTSLIKQAREINKHYLSDKGKFSRMLSGWFLSNNQMLLPTCQDSVHQNKFRILREWICFNPLCLTFFFSLSLLCIVSQWAVRAGGSRPCTRATSRPTRCCRRVATAPYAISYEQQPLTPSRQVSCFRDLFSERTKIYFLI